MDKFLVLDTNAVYYLATMLGFKSKLKAYVNANGFKLAMVPMVMVEAVTKSYNFPAEFTNIVAPAFKELRDFDITVLSDQDLLIESLAKGSIDILNHDNQWNQILQYLSICKFNGGRLETPTISGTFFIEAEIMAAVRNNWEVRYQNDWIWQLKQCGVSASSVGKAYTDATKKIDKAFLSNPTWDDVIIEIFEQRTSTKVGTNRADVLDLFKYIGQEYQCIWNKVIDSGYRPMSGKKKNDYNDMSVMLYSALSNVFVVSGDMNMVGKTNAHADGKIVLVDEIMALP